MTTAIDAAAEAEKAVELVSTARRSLEEAADLLGELADALHSSAPDASGDAAVIMAAIAEYHLGRRGPSRLDLVEKDARELVAALKGTSPERGAS